MLFIGYRHGWRLKKPQVSPKTAFCALLCRAPARPEQQTYDSSDARFSRGI